MQELLEELGERGTLVAPDAAAYLKRENVDAGRLRERLRALEELPFMLTVADVERLLQDASETPASAEAPAAPETPAPSEDAEATPPPPPPPDEPPEPAEAEEPDDRPDPDEAPLPEELAPEDVEPEEGPRPGLPEDPPAPFTPDDRGAALTAPVLRAGDNDGGDDAPAAAAAPGEAAARPERPAYAHDYKIENDVTGNSTCEGEISDFTSYFKDRLAKLRKLLRQRRDMVGMVPIDRVRGRAQAEVKICGIVTEVRSTKNGHRLIEIEDETGTANVLAPANTPNLITDADTLIEDEVVGLVTRPSNRGELLILDKIVRPDVPHSGNPRTSPHGSAVAFLSDIHFGAKTFLHDDWERFIRWINGEYGDATMKHLARKTKYLVVPGDMVDGIGIFPGQEDELDIVDGMEQYEYCAQQFERIRDDIKVFMMPGNHDLVRPAEPQPALPEKYTRLFDREIIQIGNPCKITIEGVEILSYHGRAMDDWIMRVKGLSYDEPITVMREMLQRRHVCPIYGLRTPIAPEQKDYLLIDTVPDIFVTGHVHSAGMERYRGVNLINASTWQAQTAYQKMHGFMPIPGRVPVVELDNNRPWMLDFHNNKPAGVDVTGRSNFGEAFRKPEKVNPDDVV